MENVGPTGKFPRGKLNKDDEGGINLAVGVYMESKTVIIDFRSPVKWFGLDSAGAKNFADILRKAAKEIDESLG